MSTTPPGAADRTARIRASLTGRAGVRALLSLGIVAFSLLFPVALTRVLFEVAAWGLVVLGLHGAYLSARGKRWTEVLRDVLVVSAGVAILWLRATDRSTELVAALAILLALRGILQLVGVGRDEERRAQIWPYVPGIAEILGGALIWVAPESLAVVALGVAAFWLVAGVVNLQRALNDPEAEPADLAETTSAVLDYLRRQDVGAETRAEVEEGLFFEGGSSSARMWRFVALMSFSTAIATFGIASDSTAVVIGAMLVAPLMTPILGMSASIVLGSPERLRKSALTVLLGIGVAITLSFLLSKYVGGFLDVGRNTQIASRVSPTLVDLAIAVAAGAAGAFANARRDVSDSLPGVAIAVALVPPLSVVGTLLQEAEPTMALGAFLLFATNLVGIIVAASATFFLLGLAPWFQVEARASTIGRSFATAAVALVVIAIPLSLSGEDLLDSATNQATVNRIVEEALADSAYDLVATNLGGSEVEIIVTGPADLPPFDVEALADDLSATLAREFTLVVRVIPETVITLDVDAPG